MSREVERATEKIARRLAREAGAPEAMWEMFLTDAYQEYYKMKPVPDGR